MSKNTQIIMDVLKEADEMIDGACLEYPSVRAVIASCIIDRVNGTKMEDESYWSQE